MLKKIITIFAICWIIIFVLVILGVLWSILYTAYDITAQDHKTLWGVLAFLGFCIITGLSLGWLDSQ